LTRVPKTNITSEKRVDVLNQLSKVYESPKLVADTSTMYVQRALELAGKIDYDKGAFQALSQLALVSQQTGEIEKAIDFYEKALEKTSDSAYLSEVLNNIGAIYVEKSDYETSLEYLNRALTINQSLGLPKSISKSYTSIGNTYGKMGEYERALDYHKKSLALDSMDGYMKGIAFSYVNMASIYSDLGENKLAKAYYLEARDKFKELSFRRGEATILNNIGGVYRNEGNFAGALRNYFEALKLYEEAGHEPGIAIACNNIAILYDDQKQFDLAVVYYYKSLGIKEKLGNKWGMGNTYGNLGNLYKSMDSLSRAMEFFQKSYNIRKEIGHRRGIASTLNGIGFLLIKKSQYDSAFRCFEAGIAMNHDLPSILANAYMGKGATLYHQGKYRKSKAALNQSIQLAETSDLILTLRDAFEMLAKVENALGNYKSAFGYHQRYHAYYDTLLGEEKSKQLSQLQVQYETEKKEQEIENLNQQARIQTLELNAKNRNLLLLGILVFLLVVGAGFTYVFLQQKRLVALQQAQSMEQRLLRTQMNPHFIFNAIAAIQDYMVQGEGKQAATYLSKFSKLIRQVLDNSRTEFISLDQELNMLENYLYLQNLRRDIPFTFNIVVDDALDPEEVAIPPMFAQPFIENAIEHGLASVADARVEIQFSKSDDYLSLIIEDNGVGYGKTEVKVKGHTSHATRITEERIALYRKATKKEITFTIERLTNVTQVAFQLPFTYV
ncbi:MAG: tetratricopeptide repeat protein, partial [Bacteroidota bacterium]